MLISVQRQHKLDMGHYKRKVQQLEQKIQTKSAEPEIDSQQRKAEEAGQREEGKGKEGTPGAKDWQEDEEVILLEDGHEDGSAKKGEEKKESDASFLLPPLLLLHKANQPVL